MQAQLDLGFLSCTLLCQVNYLLLLQQQTGGLLSQEGETEAVVIEVGMEDDSDKDTTST